jgi:uncharacterized protein
MHAHAPFSVAGDGDLATLAIALLLMGLAGSFTHCVGMCGPFVIAQVTAGLETSGVQSGYGTLKRLRGAALLPYHLGRMTTYTALGAASAGVLGFVANNAGFRALAAIALVAASLAMIAQALGRSLPLLDSLMPRMARAPAGDRMRGLFARPQGWRGYALGVALGFIPCGMLYAAIAAASASGSVAGGAIAMLAFALGTVPGLLGVGWAGLLFGRGWQRIAAVLAPAMMLVSAAMLLAMALRIVT